MTWESLGACDSYLIGEAMLKTALPRKAPFCQYCTYISYQQSYDRHYCRITGEWILNYRKERGPECPFNFKEE